MAGSHDLAVDDFLACGKKLWGGVGGKRVVEAMFMDLAIVSTCLELWSQPKSFFGSASSGLALFLKRVSSGFQVGESGLRSCLNSVAEV